MMKQQRGPVFGVWGGGGDKVIVCKTSLGGERVVLHVSTYMYMRHSIVNTGNVNVDFKLLTHNRYSVLNGHFIRQNHPS